MADPFDLVTSEEVTSYLADAGISAPSDLDAIITGVSVAMQSYANRNFGSHSYTVTLNGAGSDRISLPNFPITAVSALSIDGVSVSAASSPTQSGFVFSETQVLLRGSRFGRGVQNVAITYTAGFAQVPADVRRAACEAIAAVIASFDYDPRAVEVKAGGSAIKFAWTPDKAKLCFTPGVTAVLDELKRVHPC